MIPALPAESLTVTALAKDAPPSEVTVRESMKDWSLDQRLLSMIAEQLAGANWQRGGGKGSQPDLFGDSGTNKQRFKTKSPLTREQKRLALAARAPLRKEP